MSTIVCDMISVSMNDSTPVIDNFIKLISKHKCMSVFNEAGLPIRNRITEWFDIKEKIGAAVEGTFVGWFENPSRNDGFKDQVVIVIKRKGDGAVVAVALNDNPINRDRLMASMEGDEVGVRYDMDKDVGKPQKAKIINIYNPALEERAKAGKKVTTQATEAPVEDDQSIDDFLPNDSSLGDDIIDADPDDVDY